MSHPSRIKIFIVNQPAFNTNDIEFLVVRCGSDGELSDALTKHVNYIRVVACTADDIASLEDTLMIHPIDTLLLYDTGSHPIRYQEVLHKLTTTATSQRLLASSLCTKAVSCLHAEAVQHRQGENCGLADLCFNDAIRVVQWSMVFL